MLFDNGFWVHCLTQNKAGQPADVIAVRNGKGYLIDAKVCSDNEFHVKRVEENQSLAMDLWSDRGNGQGWFALKLNDEVYMLPHIMIKAFMKTQSKISETEIRECGTPFGKWVKKCK
jgi:Holliday junction resolvase